MDYYMIDVLEEDALNQKYCTEVLRKLVSKADTDIEELEGELLLFETQLEWAKQNKGTDIFDLCCKKLGEGINLLELSICSLKSKKNHDDGHDIAQESQMGTEPVKKVYEIIKSLLDNSFQDKNEQLADMEVVEDSSDCLEHSVIESNHNQTLSKIGSTPTETEEVKEASVNPMDADKRVDLSSEPEKMINNQPQKIVLEGASVTDIDRLEGSLILQIKKEVYIDLDPVDNVEQRLSATDVARFLESQRTTDITQTNNSKVQEASDTVITNGDSLKPSLGLKEQSKKIKMEAKKNSADMVDKSKLSLKVQNQQTKDIIHVEKIKVQETGVANTTSSGRPKSSSTWEGKNKKKIAKSEQDEIRKLQGTSADKVKSPMPPLKFQRQRAGDKVHAAKCQVQEVVQDNDSVSGRKMSSLMLQRQSGQVGVQPSKFSATGEIVSSKPTVKMPRPRKKDKVPSNNFLSEEISHAVTTELDLILKGQKPEGVIQSLQAAKAFSTKEVSTSKPPRKLLRQAAKEMIQSNTIQAQQSLGADTGVAITLLSLIDLTHEVPEIGNHIVQSDPFASEKVGVPPENGTKSKIVKRQRQLEVDIPNSAVTTNNTGGRSTSTSNKKRRRMIIMSSSDDEPSETPGYERISLESIFKLSMVSCDVLKESNRACDTPHKSCHKANSKIKYHPEPSNFANADTSGKGLSQALAGPQEFREWTAMELRSLARIRGLKGFSKLRKEELVNLLTEVKDD